MPHYTCLIIGSGFSGSLLAELLMRSGKHRILLVDRSDHPRFAIGESSTPIADILLYEIAERFGLETLKPLCRYGNWIKEYEDVDCGLKRGFSYFKHHRGRAFETDATNANQLLVTASDSDEAGDTHWYRPEVDQLLLSRATAAGADFMPKTEVIGVDASENGGWKIRFAGNQPPITTDFIVDASGSAGVLQKHLDIQDTSDQLHTRTSTTFAHVDGLPTWNSQMQSAGYPTDQHPYACDDAAVHHLLDDGWLWMLRFRGGRTSVGRVWSTHEASTPNKVVDPGDPFRIDDYPSLQAMFSEATIVDPPDGPRSTAIPMQRLCGKVSGDNWALLPSAAVTLDPLHSSGIAHSLACVHRLATILVDSNHANFLPTYSKLMTDEIELMDLLVDGAYKAMVNFDLFCAYSMLYFTAAISCEESLDGGMLQASVEQDPKILGQLWLAGDWHFRTLVARYHKRVCQLSTHNRLDKSDVTRFTQDLCRELRPRNQWGLMDDNARRMYRYTGASKTE